ncbi:hypothetical protein CQ010_05415 [Arthrobacter sp. MYb211]|uniref:iron-containing alcohol dehydrogenase n=1 Tax=unclassified Arthrobacter TaxID=235627 RepID=UPI000CFB76D9|nr:hypothetical protein CQ017_00385 [Arthrobacter sp. MYb224]PRA13970.1 hypothetical protein CQ015_01405 [Arthrobacter sp. MYb221]PRC09341.1 hypothetical protein CQ010_05415 [Arthrobacter sp. MYb211]
MSSIGNSNASHAVFSTGALIATGQDSVTDLCVEAVRRHLVTQAIIVTDTGVSTLASVSASIAMVGREIEVVRTIILPETTRATLSWAREIRDALRTVNGSICVAIGGGAVLDAAKTAVAALDQPWLLDNAVWRSSSGLLPTVRNRERGIGSPMLLAVSTRPGTAAQLAPRITLAISAGESQHMATGEGLIPDYVAVNSELWAGIGIRAVLEALCEILFRALGPYLVTQRCSEDQRVLLTSLIDDIVLAGWSTIQSRGNLTPADRFRIDELSMASLDPRRTSGWTPSTHPWWCIQNSLASSLSLPKRTLTLGGFRAVLAIRTRTVDPLRSRFRSALVHPLKPDVDVEEVALDFLNATYAEIGFAQQSLSSDTIDKVIDETFRMWGPVMVAGGWGDTSAVKKFLEEDLCRILPQPGRLA